VRCQRCDTLAVTTGTDDAAINPMHEVVMVIVDCPWCDAPVALVNPESVRCEGCRVEVEIDPAPAALIAVAEVALAA
jgi:hypothetical protein